MAQELAVTGPKATVCGLVDISVLHRGDPLDGARIRIDLCGDSAAQ